MLGDCYNFEELLALAAVRFVVVHVEAKIRKFIKLGLSTHDTNLNLKFYFSCRPVDTSSLNKFRYLLTGNNCVKF